MSILDVGIERQKAHELVQRADRELLIAQRTELLVDLAVATGVMTLKQLGVTHQEIADPPNIFSQAYAMARRLTE